MSSIETNVTGDEKRPRFHALFHQLVDKHDFLILFCRFVVAGSQLKKAIVPQSAGRFKFDDVYGLDQIQVTKFHLLEQVGLTTLLFCCGYGL